jgi:hypothetical protein
MSFSANTNKINYLRIIFSKTPKTEGAFSLMLIFTSQYHKKAVWLGKIHFGETLC